MAANSLAKNLKVLLRTNSMIRQLSSEATSNTKQTYDFKTLKVTNPDEFVFHVEFNRPEKRNAMSPTFFRFFI